MIEKAERTIALNNPYYHITVIYDNPRPFMGTPFFSEAMDEICDVAGEIADRIIEKHLKKMHEERLKNPDEKIVFYGNGDEPF